MQHKENKPALHSSRLLKIAQTGFLQLPLQLMLPSASVLSYAIQQLGAVYNLELLPTVSGHDDTMIEMHGVSLSAHVALD